MKKTSSIGIKILPPTLISQITMARNSPARSRRRAAANPASPPHRARGRPIIRPPSSPHWGPLAAKKTKVQLYHD